MSTEPNKPDPKDMPINIRMLLAFVLTGLVIFGWNYIFPPPKPPEKPVLHQTKTVPQPAKDNPAAVTAPPPKAQTPAASDATVVAAASQQKISIDTDLYHIEFSNQGAVVKNWTLKKYLDRDGKPLDLVNTEGVKKKGYPFQYEFRSANPTNPGSVLNTALFQSSKDGLNITFTYSKDGVTAKKSFGFRNGSYSVQLESSVTTANGPLPHLLAWRAGFGDMAVPNAASQESEVFYDTGNNDVQRDKVKVAKDAPFNNDGTQYNREGHLFGLIPGSVSSFSWAGVEDQYFTALFIPKPGVKLQTTIYEDKVPTPLSQTEDPFMGVAIGGAADNQLTLFVGPKDPDILAKPDLDPTLEKIINFGFFWFISKPLYSSLHWLHDHWIPNYGWSIIFATIIINVALFPLKLANLKSMRKMQALQPEIAKINEKYKALSLRDPKQADKNAEMMALYQKAGTNPMSGCIPMLIQMPFLWAFYTVLSVSIALRGASWLWVGDLSQSEQIAIRVLPILLVITGFIMQKMTPMTSVDPNQQKTMMFMPLMMGFIFYQASSGLVLYWLTSNLVGIAQQWLLNRAMPKPATPATPAKEVKKSSNRK